MDWHWINYLWNYWPPFFFTGIKMQRISRDFRQVTVRLKKRFWNANYVGTQFGGAIYAMADPFYMLMLIKTLGPKYSVWDKSAAIRYLKPGRTDLTAEFRLTEEEINGIIKDVAEKGRVEWVREIQIVDTDGEIVAEVDKLISIKLRGE